MISILLFAIIFVMSCNKDTTKPNTQASEYFPNAVGDYWEYQVHDSSDVQQHPTSSRDYTVTVTVAGTKKMADGLNANIWQYKYPWGDDTNYVRTIQDTIKIFENAYSSTIEYLKYPRIIYFIPFYNQERWTGKLIGIDTFYVDEELNVSSPFFSFDSCFKIHEYYAGPNIEVKDDYWLKPNIGLIKKYKNEYSLGPLDIELWQLKNYHLK